MKKLYVVVIWMFFFGFYGCSGNVLSDKVNEVSEVSEIQLQNKVFEEITVQLDDLNSRYLSDLCLLTRAEKSETELSTGEFMMMLAADCTGAFTGGRAGGFIGASIGSLFPGLGTVIGTVTGVAVGGVLVGTALSLDAYEKDKDGGGGGGGGGGDGDESNVLSYDELYESLIASASPYSVNRLYPIRDTGVLEDIDCFMFGNIGYYHNEIIKSYIYNYEKFYSDNIISQEELLYRVICEANIAFGISASEPFYEYLFQNIEQLFPVDIYSIDLDDSEWDISEEYAILVEYLETVSKLDNYDIIYAYTVDFMSVIESVCVDYPELEASLALINGSVSVAIYSRTLWNLYEIDSCLLDKYPLYNIVTQEWEYL